MTIQHQFSPCMKQNYCKAGLSIPQTEALDTFVNNYFITNSGFFNNWPKLAY